MSKAPVAIRVSAILCTIFLLPWTFGSAGAAPREAAPAAPPGSSRAEQWAWAQISHGDTADFNKLEDCKNAQVSNAVNLYEEGWHCDCRVLRGRFLQQLLTQAPWRDAIPFAGVRIAHARIDGDVDLEDAELERAITITGSRIGGSIKLSRARTKSQISIYGSVITERFEAQSFVSESNLQLGSAPVRTTFGEINLKQARVLGQIVLGGASVEGEFSANEIDVGGDFSNPVDKIKASFKKFQIVGAHIKGNLNLDGSNFEGEIDAKDLTVGGNLSMASSPKLKKVILTGAKIAGDVSFEGAQFSGPLKAGEIEIGRDLSMKNAHANSGEFNLRLAHIGGDVELSGARLGEVSLSGATVGGEFFVDERSEWSNLDLRNAHVRYLENSETAWNQKGSLTLEGFRFDYLGTHEDHSGRVVKQPKSWWAWVKRDPEYRPAPYVQLAKAFESAGDADAAEDIRYEGRDAAREKACEAPLSRDCALQWFLKATIGYGIGYYKFFALLWVIGFSLLGMFMLKKCVPETEAHWQNKGWFWCLFACLSQILPGVNLRKEFADFFDGPTSATFNTRLQIWFGFTRFAGFLLGATLLAAFAGLTQG